MQLRISNGRVYLSDKVDQYQWYYLSSDGLSAFLGSREFCDYQGNGTYACSYRKGDEVGRVQMLFLLGDSNNVKTMTGNWNFDKLDQGGKDELLKLFNTKQVDAIVALHDKYELSPYAYCCGAKHNILNYIEYAVQNNLL